MQEHKNDGLSMRDLLIRVHQKLTDLDEKLYGNGGDDGDVPELKACFAGVKKEVDENKARIKRLETIVAVVAFLAGSGYAIFQLVQFIANRH